uniref:Endonuclease/exonuclease/phosphatase domain-containing protein n=1 Tax=Ananas comosus var. bracteatus TaxID=296719 RepID=A0A6V7PK74_ANACO|nr:unnamed protein product [Ananas comosus var. bracteatus]
MYRFLTWNVRGLNNSGKCTVVKNFLRFSKCAAVCLQETKLSSTSQSKFFSFCGFHLRDFRTLDAAGTRGGLLTAWNPFLFDLLDMWTRSFSLNVVLKCKANGTVFMLSNIYGPTGGALRAEFFQEIRNISLQSQGRWALLGDFNVLLSLSDKNGTLPIPMRF